MNVGKSRYKIRKCDYALFVRLEGLECFVVLHKSQAFVQVDDIRFASRDKKLGESL